MHIMMSRHTITLSPVWTPPGTKVPVFNRDNFHIALASTKRIIRDMEMSDAIQLKLAQHFLPLVQAHLDDVRMLTHLLALCEVANNFASDDHSVTYDMTEYVQECLAVARGNGDEAWCEELLDTLKADMAALSD